jgi:V/A-type H+-transporting ATPase subunit A
MNQGRIIKVAGPLVLAEGMKDCNMFDVVRVSSLNLIGEVIEMRDDVASIQVYEETSGLGPGEPYLTTGMPLSLQLAPGMIENIFDGIQRPLETIKELVGNNITRGIKVDALDRNKKWEFAARVKIGQKVQSGDILGVVQETVIIEHRIMLPYGISGTVEQIFEGRFTIEEVIAVIKTDDGQSVNITMLQKWPVRVARPIKEKIVPDAPLVSGQRVIDTFFPIAKGVLQQFRDRSEAERRLFSTSLRNGRMRRLLYI